MKSDGISIDCEVFLRNSPIPIPAFPLKGKVDADLFLPFRGRIEVGVGVTLRPLRFKIE